MGMTNILVLTGDYSGKGFAGQSAPVFDLDPANLLCMFSMLNDKAQKKAIWILFSRMCGINVQMDGIGNLYPVLQTVQKSSHRGKIHHHSHIKVVMGILMFVFAMFELLPVLRDLRVDRKYLFWGGLLSGFSGGLSGHQGALRSAFLIKTGVSTKAFVGTNAVIGFMVDMARIVVYAGLFVFAISGSPIHPGQWPLILSGIFAAFAGVMIGKRWMHKVTMEAVKWVTGLLLLVIAFLLGAGII
jgi:uncharacterized membrane protein YfcA